MRCELEEDDIGNFPGVTLFTKENAHCIKPTAVYLPPNPAARGNVLDVVIWLHGFAVIDHKFLFRNDPARIREQVRDSNKNVVLIAPFLGYEYSVGNGFAGKFNVKDLATRNWANAT
jgi:hypothetical protein